MKANYKIINKKELDETYKTLMWCFKGKGISNIEKSSLKYYLPGQILSIFPYRNKEQNRVGYYVVYTPQGGYWKTIRIISIEGGHICDYTPQMIYKEDIGKDTNTNMKILKYGHIGINIRYDGEMLYFAGEKTIILPNEVRKILKLTSRSRRLGYYEKNILRKCYKTLHGNFLVGVFKDGKIISAYMGIGKYDKIKNAFFEENKVNNKKNMYVLSVYQHLKNGFVRPYLVILPLSHKKSERGKRYIFGKNTTFFRDYRNEYLNYHFDKSLLVKKNRNLYLLLINREFDIESGFINSIITYRIELDKNKKIVEIGNEYFNSTYNEMFCCNVEAIEETLINKKLEETILELNIGDGEKLERLYSY